MTRLKSEWIADIGNTIEECQEYLKKVTGRDFRTLVGNEKWPDNLKIAVIPITQGEGIIGNFAESVVAIVKAMGFNAYVTNDSDVAGIYEASLKNADVIFIADDKRFIAINMKNGKIADNNVATAIGYVNALEGGADGISDKKILLLGYGKVGKEIYKELISKGGTVTVYDEDQIKQKEMFETGVEMIENPNQIKDFKYLIDATNTGNWINEDMINRDVFIVSPGVPLSLSQNAYEKCRGRIIHDYLQIGVATMLRMVV